MIFDLHSLAPATPTPKRRTSIDSPNKAPHSRARYCQQAVCSPSRSSLLTGQRPDSTRVHDLVTHFRKALPNVVTLPQYFKNHGYYAHGIGKIYHGGYNDEPSWSVPWEATKGSNFGPDGQKILGELKAKAKEANADVTRVRGLPTEAPDIADEKLNDGWTANRAIEILKERKGKKEPFFLAVGFAKPHLPFVAPKKYSDHLRCEQTASCRFQCSARRGTCFCSAKWW